MHVEIADVLCSKLLWTHKHLRLHVLLSSTSKPLSDVLHVSTSCRILCNHQVMSQVTQVSQLILMTQAHFDCENRVMVLGR